MVKDRDALRDLQILVQAIEQASSSGAIDASRATGQALIERALAVRALWPELRIRRFP